MTNNSSNFSIASNNLSDNSVASTKTSGFSLPAIDVYINSLGNPEVLDDAQTPKLADTSYQINLNVDSSLVNQIFLFYTNDITNNYNVSNLNELSNNGLKYAFNINQWNPSIETSKSERKHIIENYLIDLFGYKILHVLKNVDVFSNEKELDDDIIDIFENRCSQEQRLILDASNGSNIHGSFKCNSSLKSANHSIINDASSSNLDAITRKLLEIASAVSNDSNNVFRRQFDQTNTSNNDFNLPPGWRTFKFIENDVISFNVIINQPASFFPSWSDNSYAIQGNARTTSYNIKLLITDNSYGILDKFSIPIINIQELDIFIQDISISTIVSDKLSISDQCFNVISISNEIINDSNVVLQSSIILDLSFYRLRPYIDSISDKIKTEFSSQFNINPLYIIVTIEDYNSIIIIIKQLSDIVKSITSQPDYINLPLFGGGPPGPDYV